MTTPAPDTLAGFRAKWAQACPEQAMALGFVAPARRPAREAWLDLVHELGQAAYELHDAEPALVKLQWWANELAHAAGGAASHPLTQVLAQEPAFARLPPAQWQAAIEGALRQRDDAPAASAAALLDAHRALHAPLAELEAQLFAPLDAPSLARARTFGRALRELARFDVALADGRLPLPLDLLARHRLARGDLAHPSPQRSAALREWLGELARGMADTPGRGIGAVAAATLAADRWRIAQALRRTEPTAVLPALLAHVPMRATWAAWRARERVA